MTDRILQDRITELRNALSHLERHPDRHLPTEESLNEFQSIVDNTRQDVWTVLTALNSDHHDEFVTAFRLRRASDMLEQVYADLGDGVLPAPPDVLDALRDAIDRLVEAKPDPID